MKRLPLLLLPLLAACGGGSSGRPENSPDELRFEMAVASRIAYDPARLKKGEWALYSVKVLGRAQSDLVKFQVVDEDASSVWVESKVPSPPKDLVLKSRFDRAGGKILEHWRGEPGSPTPEKIFPSEGSAKEAPVQRDTSRAQSDLKEEVDQIQVGGKTWTAARITMTLAYPDGRKSVLTDWYHKDVPFTVAMGSKSYGGLVKRQFGRLTMELIDSDTKGAKAELVLPR